MPPADAPRWASPVSPRVALWVVAAAAAWWLLEQLASVLRPMLLAALLGYILLPTYRRLRSRTPAAVALGLIAGLTTLVLAGLATALYASLLGFREEVPELRATATDSVRRGLDWVDANVPSWIARENGRPFEDKVGEFITEGTRAALSAAGGGLVEVLTAGLYLLFFLIESDRFAERVRAAYGPVRAEGILHAAGRINAAIVGYLKAKVKASVLLALAVWLALTACGVRFSLLWAVLTFLCNFIPYLGSVVAVALPVGFAFLQLDFGARPLVAAGLVLLCHVASASAVEPVILGRAVGLSPVIILASLSTWGLIWGLPGLFLAVPLTVVIRLAAENVGATTPAAKLVGGE